MSSRRIRVVLLSGAALTATAVLAYELVMPWLVASEARRTLAAYGFPDAHLAVGDVGLGEVELRDVRIADGFELGRVSFDRGLSLLWSDPDRITVHDAKLSVSGIEHVARAARRDGAPPSFDRIDVDRAAVSYGEGTASVSGTVTSGDDGIDVSVEIRAPGPTGWSATARGRIAWNAAGHARLEDGVVEVAVPSIASDRTEATGVRLTATVRGDVSSRMLEARGHLAVERIAVGGFLAIEDAQLPFTVTTRDGAIAVDVPAATATAVGGELSIDPFVFEPGKAIDVVARARRLELDRALAALGHGRVAGTGLFDGELTLHRDGSGWSVVGGELRSRGGGTLGVSDAGLRDRLATLDSPFAIHQRITGALADFAYDELVAELRGPEADPELRVALRGAGRKIHQDLDIVVGVRGVRDVVGRYATRGTP